MSSNIVLVMPHLHERWRYRADLPHPPTGIFSIGTYLANAGYEVRIVDANLYPDYIGRILDCVDIRTLFVGLSVMSTQVRRAVEIAQALRKARPHTRIIWGGVHPTLFPEQIAASPWADGVIIGQGEETSLELANALQKERSDGDIAGLGWKEDGGVRFGPQRGLIDISRFPFPRYDLLDVENYIASDFRSTRRLFGRFLRTFTIHSANGCPYPCTFCINTFHDDFYRRYRFKTAKQIADEMQYLNDRYGVEYICFRDENFAMHKRRLAEYLEEYESRGLNSKWYCTVRADYFNHRHLSGEMLARMVQDGCIALAIGAESGSADTLNLLKKGITREQIQGSASAVSKYKIVTSFSFMVGVPGESRKDAIETMRLARDIIERSPESYIIGPFLFRPYPGASLFDRCVEMGFQPPARMEEWYGYDFQDLDNIPWLQDNRAFWRFVTFYCEAQLYLRFKGIPVLKWPFKLIGLLRLGLGVYGGLWEKTLYSMLVTLYRNIRHKRQVSGDLHLSPESRGVFPRTMACF